jgi:hypothetical protein
MLLLDTRERMLDGGWYCTTAREKRGGREGAFRDDGTKPVSSCEVSYKRSIC